MIKYEEMKGIADIGMYARFTYREYLKRISSKYPDYVPVIIAAKHDNKPIGMAIAQPEDSQKQAELLSLWVDKDYQNQGIATELLNRIEQECLGRDVFRLYCQYLNDNDTSPALERTLKKCNFSKPEPKMLAIRCSIESIKTAPWFRKYKLPSHFSIRPWVTLTEIERNQIARSNANAQWIPEDLVPFLFESNMEPITSVALLVKGEVRGWVINHWIDGNLRFTCSYMHPDQQRLGRILLLYNESVRLMPSINASVGMWAVPLKHKRMVDFSTRWFKPYSIYFDFILESEKLLSVIRL